MTASFDTARSAALVVGGSALVAVGIACTCTSSPSPSPTRTASDEAPNVLVVVWDTVRADRTSLYGHDRPTTPRLVERAADARVYEHAWAPSFWTVPSHASMFTGLSPTEHGANSKRHGLRDDHPTLAEQLTASGWDTYLFTANPTLLATGLDRGFEVVERKRSPRWIDAVEDYNRGKFHPEDASTPHSPKYDGPPAKRGGKGLYKDAGPYAEKALLHWLDTRESDAPWFAVLNYMEAHQPRLPTAESRAAVIPDDLQEPALQTPAHLRRIQNLNRGRATLHETGRQAWLATYDAAIHDLDLLTDSLLDSLEAQGHIDETTWVVLVSDHGENFGEHGRYGHSHDLYEPLVRVPLVVWGPDVEPGRVDTPVSATDVYALVRSVTGLGDAGIDTDGVVMSERVRSFGGRKDPLTAFRQGRYKLVIAPNGSTAELYDLSVDPDETEDLAAQFPERVDEMRRRLDAYRAGEVLPPPDAPRELDADVEAELQALGYVDD